MRSEAEIAEYGEYLDWMFDNESAHRAVMTEQEAIEHRHMMTWLEWHRLLVQWVLGGGADSHIVAAIEKYRAVEKAKHRG